MTGDIFRRPIARQLGKFGLVGLAATAVHAAVFLSAVELLPIGSIGSNILAFCTAFGISYVGNYRWTFGSELSANRPGRFLITSLIGLGINVLGAWLILDVANQPSIMLLPAIIFLAPLTVFALSRWWVFRS